MNAAPGPQPVAGVAAATAAALQARALRRVVAQLARTLGWHHLALAEDAVQTAALRAWQAWPEQGLPDNPGGWLYTVARRAALDALKHDERNDPWPDDAAESGLRSAIPEPRFEPSDQRFTSELDDDELALLFACCHPALPQSTQVALALRSMLGLSLELIAAALFTTAAAVAQRLARARHLLEPADAAVPCGAALTQRREAVLTVLPLVYWAGQHARQRMASACGKSPGSNDSERVDSLCNACWEGIRLARAVAAHPLTAHADADAVAALLLLHGARLTGRIDEAGDIVPLPGQPRDRWDGGMIRLGLAHLQAAQRASALSRWHLLAGIAAEHAVAPSYGRTDWQAIARYYEMLLGADASAAPTLGHAIALAESGALAEAEQRLQALLVTVPHALRAHTLAALSRVCERAGQTAQALFWLDQAIACAPSQADARMLKRRADALESG